jgi:hypothetical protein
LTGGNLAEPSTPIQAIPVGETEAQFVQQGVALDLSFGGGGGGGGGLGGVVGNHEDEMTASSSSLPRAGSLDNLTEAVHRSLSDSYVLSRSPPQ